MELARGELSIASLRRKARLADRMVGNIQDAVKELEGLKKPVTLKSVSLMSHEEPFHVALVLNALKLVSPWD